MSNLEQTASPVAFDTTSRDDIVAASAPARRFEIGRRGLQLLSWLAPVALLVVWGYSGLVRGWLQGGEWPTRWFVPLLVAVVVRPATSAREASTAEKHAA